MLKKITSKKNEKGNLFQNYKMSSSYAHNSHKIFIKEQKNEMKKKILEKKLEVDEMEYNLEILDINEHYDWNNLMTNELMERFLKETGHREVWISKKSFFGMYKIYFVAQKGIEDSDDWDIDDELDKIIKISKSWNFPEFVVDINLFEYPFDARPAGPIDYPTFGMPGDVYYYHPSEHGSGSEHEYGSGVYDKEMNKIVRLICDGKLYHFKTIIPGEQNMTFVEKFILIDQIKLNRSNKVE